VKLLSDAKEAAVLSTTLDAAVMSDSELIAALTNVYLLVFALTVLTPTTVAPPNAYLIE